MHLNSNRQELLEKNSRRKVVLFLHNHSAAAVHKGQCQNWGTVSMAKGARRLSWHWILQSNPSFFWLQSQQRIALGWECVSGAPLCPGRWMTLAEQSKATEHRENLGHCAMCSLCQIITVEKCSNQTSNLKSRSWLLNPRPKYMEQLLLTL